MSGAATSPAAGATTTDDAPGLLDAILSNHNYPPVIERLLAEALTLTALLGTTLKDVGGQLTVQAQSQNGVIDLLVCDYKGGEMRGYVRHDVDRLAAAPVDPSLIRRRRSGAALPVISPRRGTAASSILV